MRTSQLYILILSLCFCACQSDERTYDASGVFETTEVIVSARTAGELVSFSADEGDSVKLGQLLGCVDTLQLMLQRKQLLASLSATDSRKLSENRQLASLREQIAVQQRERLRYEQLVRGNAAPQKTLDDINHQIGVLQRNLDALAEQVESSNNSLKGQSASIMAQVEQIDNSLRLSKITAPISGIVLEKYAEQGEFATTGRALFKLSDITDMKLRAYLTAEQVNGIRLGQKVKVYADSGKNERKEYAGIITWISDKAEFTPKTIQTRDERANLVYAVKISVHNDGLIKRGMYGEVCF